MSDDKLDFLDETQSEEVEAPEAETPPEPKTVQAEEAEPAVATEEAAQGDAKPKESTGEQEATPPVADAGKLTQSVPLTVLLDEREKRQKAEREAEQLRQWREQAQAQQAQGRKPDFFDNPERALQQAVLETKAQQSRFLAEREFGADVVREAVAFFNDPRHMPMTQQFLSHPSPFHSAVEYYQQQKFLSEVKNPEEWKKTQLERLREEAMAAVKAELQAQAPAKPKTPPPSVAASAASGTDRTVTPGNAFDSMFGD